MTTFRRWLRRVCSWGGTLTEMVKLLQGWSQKQRLGRKERHKYKVVFNPGLMPSLQDLAFYVTEMPAEQMKRKVTLLLIIRAILAKFFTAESRASLAFLEDSKRVQQFNSSSILPLRLSRLHQKVLQSSNTTNCYLQISSKIWWLLLLLWRISRYGGVLGGEWSGPKKY